MNEGNLYAFGGIVMAMCLAGVALVLAFTAGRDWRERYDALAARTAALEARVGAYDAIGKSPAVLQESLNRYWKISEAKTICDFGGTYKTGSNKIVQCFVIEIPEEPKWLAGL